MAFKKEHDFFLSNNFDDDFLYSSPVICDIYREPYYWLE